MKCTLELLPEHARSYALLRALRDCRETAPVAPYCDSDYLGKRQHVAAVRGVIPSAACQQAIRRLRCPGKQQAENLRMLARLYGVPITAVRAVAEHQRKCRGSASRLQYWYGERLLDEPARCPRCKARCTRLVGDVCVVCFSNGGRDE